MTANLVLAITAGILVAAGVYLLLERSLTRILLGIMVASNGVNLMFLVAAGKPALPPIVGLGDSGADGVSDPLPQAMVLTAIVITMAVAAFVLTMAYRSFQLHGHDEVADDVEDARIRQLAQADVTSESYEDTTFSDTGADVVSE
ncbi:hypothetical protein GCM10025789_10310 [Tessaracoccus lubricantis]|uniref:Na(+)/H(+) antiporter subunit C n=1 Tax=Tessaracoccus lubricantis TaxID=545543 RepID=A0ABP9F5K8_9ACTN